MAKKADTDNTADESAADNEAVKASGAANTSSATAADQPAEVANAAGLNGVEGRNAASTAAEPNDKDGQALTDLEATQRSAIESVQGDDQRSSIDTVGASSQTVQNPDPEMRADKTNDVLTMQREQMQRQIREAGEVGDPTGLQALHEEVSAAQAEVDAAIKRRDLARDNYDREAEKVALRQEPRGSQVIGEYLRAQHEQREAEIKRINESRGK